MPVYEEGRDWPLIQETLNVYSLVFRASGEIMKASEKVDLLPDTRDGKK